MTIAVPSNLSVFYSSVVNKNALFQGDILLAKEIGLKEEGDGFSPDHWLVISKSCDLSLNDGAKTRNESITLLPFRALNRFLELFGYKISDKCLSKNIILIPLVKLLETFKKSKENKTKVDNLIKDKLSKFMFFPPDGNIFKEPMILDFDFPQALDGGNEEEVKNALHSKVLQLNSPFREKVSQRFALHYSSIGVEDDEIRDKNYIKSIQKEFTDLK